MCYLCFLLCILYTLRWHCYAHESISNHSCTLNCSSGHLQSMLFVRYEFTTKSFTAAYIGWVTPYTLLNLIRKHALNKFLWELSGSAWLEIDRLLWDIKNQIKQTKQIISSYWVHYLQLHYMDLGFPGPFRLIKKYLNLRSKFRLKNWFKVFTCG